MSRSLLLNRILLAALLVAGCAVRALAAERSVDETLAAINRLPAAERLAALADGAKKERELVWYSTMNRENSLELAQTFEKDHPYISVKILNGSAVNTMTRITSEFHARTHLFDVTHIRGLFLSALKKSSIIARYQTPLRQTLRRDYVDADGYFNGIFTQANLFIVNKNLVKPENYPKRFEDLLLPFWKGRMAMELESYDWLAALLDYYGEEKGKALAEKLGRQQPDFRRGSTLLSQLTAAGEFAIHVDGYNHTAYQLKQKQAPIEYIFPEPYIPAKTPTAVWIAANAPHRHAAALFADFLLSRKGQELMASQGRWVSRKDVPYLLDPGARKVQMVSLKWGERDVELIQLFNKLLRRQGE
ncbi:MAG TPA: extracellular solute-binding protein [Candidatus Binatia bacterium]|jgi:iron(III) transport system substrate-binding protein